MGQEIYNRNCLNIVSCLIHGQVKINLSSVDPIYSLINSAWDRGPVHMLPNPYLFCPKYDQKNSNIPLLIPKMTSFVGPIKERKTVSEMFTANGFQIQHNLGEGFPKKIANNPFLVDKLPPPPPYTPQQN